MLHRTKGDKSQQHVDGPHPTTKTRMPQFAPSRLLPERTLRGNYESIVGRSPQMLKVLKQVDKIANTIAKVLICGETGTGKELIARALHQNSERSAK